MSLRRLFGLVAAPALLALGACADTTVIAAAPVDPTPPAPPTVPVDTTKPARPRPPNIVVLLADDQRWDALGVYGNPIIQTPNIDALAREGVRFANAYVTTPICAISRASIFSGTYARAHGILDFDTDFSPAALAETYPMVLKQAGFRTGFVGKYGVGAHPPAAAFDYWKGFAGQGKYEQTDSLGRPVHLTRLMTQQAIAFLESQPADRPFMLSVSFKAPHVQDEDPRQFILDPQDAPLYQGVTIPEAPVSADSNWREMPEILHWNHEGRIRWQGLFSTPEKYQASVKGYYSLVTGMDRAVGAIREALRRKGLDSNTVIVYTSDNGFFLGEHGLSHKWFGYEQSVRVPLVVYDPRATAPHGRVESQIALNIDIAPTLLDMAGAPIPARMHGRSLVPVMRGPQPGWREDFLFEHLYDHPMIPQSVGVVGGRYKYLRYLLPDPDYEQLFDLQTDPHERVNLAYDPRFQSILAGLRRRYDELAAAGR